MDSLLKIAEYFKVTTDDLLKQNTAAPYSGRGGCFKYEKTPQRQIDFAG